MGKESACVPHLVLEVHVNLLDIELEGHPYIVPCRGVCQLRDRNDARGGGLIGEINMT